MRRHPFLTAYLVLLALSTCVRWRSDAFVHRIPPIDRWEFGKAAPVLILLDEQRHLPGPRLVEALGLQEHTVIMTREPIDSAMTPPLGRVDLVAYGTAGPAAINYAADHPDHIRSLTLVDADGIEDFDLLGDHNLNQVLRRAQVISTETAKALVPHFGILDVMTWGEEMRARTLLAVDRRGIRGTLSRWDGPTAIFLRDSTTSRSATDREHNRLLPQSLLARWDRDSLLAFLARVDAGTATTRATASPERIAAAALPFDAHGVSSAEGSALYIVLLLLAFTTLLSEDLACVTAGMLAARGSIPLLPAIIACYLGIIVGDQLLYLLGRSAGRALVTRIPIKWILTPERLDRACEWFRTNGMKVVLTSRFLPGTRFPVYVAAGILRGGFVRFALWLMAIGAVWTPALVGLSYEATRQGRTTIEALPGATWLWALGLILGGTFLLRLLVPLVTAEGRRGAAESLQRATGTGPKSPSE